MSETFLFQRYSQGENQATNNVILFLQLIYRSAPERLERLLTALTDAKEISLGPHFRQQFKERTSVPDGGIQQNTFSLFVETKLGASFDQAQMERHIDALSDREGDRESKIMLGVSTSPPATDEINLLSNYADEKSCQFYAVTFANILQEAREVVPAHDEFLFQACDDFGRYLDASGLVDWYSRLMPIFPCGASYEENIKLGVYYHPAHRPTVQKYKFIGIYTRKAVRAIGKIAAVVTVGFEGGSPVFELLVGDDLEAAKKRVLEVVAAVNRYHDLTKEPHRFYLFTEPASATHIEKTTTGGIQGMRYLDMPKLIETHGSAFDPARVYSAAELAELLDGAEFE